MHRTPLVPAILPNAVANSLINLIIISFDRPDTMQHLKCYYGMDADGKSYTELVFDNTGYKIAEARRAAERTSTPLELDETHGERIVRIYEGGYAKLGGGVTHYTDIVFSDEIGEVFYKKDNIFPQYVGCLVPFILEWFLWGKVELSREPIVWEHVDNDLGNEGWFLNMENKG